MKLQFQTNLDQAKRDVSALNNLFNAQYTTNPPESIIPRIGESITFTFEKYDRMLKRNTQFYYYLRVVDVSYDYTNRMIVVELHMPKIFDSIAEWMTYFRRHRLDQEY